MVELTLVRTERLDLLALTAEQLALVLDDQAALARALQIDLDPRMADTDARRAIVIKLARMASTPPEEYPWHTYWLLVVRDERRGVGLAGFKGAPNERGEVEVGYGLSPDYRNKGYMTETVRALVRWAFDHPACEAVLADTNPDNIASQRVLRKAGLRQVASTPALIFWRLDRRDAERAERFRREAR